VAFDDNNRFFERRAQMASLLIAYGAKIEVANFMTRRMLKG
jgi:hypothetical protein